MSAQPLPRRILMTADAVGGVWSYALELCRGLALQGVEVALATMGPRPSGDQRAALAALGNVTLHESDYRLEWMDDPWADVRAASEWLLDIEWSVSPDVVHLNGFAHGALPTRAPRLVVAHSCVLSWWQAVRNQPAPANWSRYRTLVAGGMKSADLVVAPSHAMLAAVREHYGVNGGRVIANGRQAEDFHRPARKEPFVLSVGRVWDEAKNIATLATIAPGLAWPVHVVGDDRSPDGQRRTLAGVTAHGRCDAATVASLMARASLYALPARYEPFGLSALEAALSGCALVLGDIPSLREIWGDAAVFVPPTDPPALRDAINGLIGDPSRRERLAGLARARARRFSAAEMTSSYLSTYRELIARRRASLQLSALSA